MCVCERKAYALSDPQMALAKMLWQRVWGIKILLYSSFEWQKKCM